MIADTKKAVVIYESIVTTDNEVLNTILTEKSLHCNNNNIRLSCIVNTAELDFINIIDLYIVIGNALDNAIECVERFLDEEKKTISFSISINGNFVCISTENYYDGDIVIKDGLPVTVKDNSDYHGLGTKSIRLIARKYGGDIRISTDNGIFALQILIPISSRSSHRGE